MIDNEQNCRQKKSKVEFLTYAEKLKRERERERALKILKRTFKFRL